ncbi:peptide chain release factor subunit 3 [Nematocida minor]|uniref:peptide chain release factor subunit 3 n=1 Tax=Nematocida minor TaxID=1912983 RepID=UPI002221124A|nr:peptide chain release factor subunit 3 [Nematocida minor]KAI5191096.1 peptide chain release factor subunit 3 [Nematocida minor]
MEEQLAESLKNISIKKKNVSIVFIGHVDAGKSTTGGQILYLSGKIDKRTLEKYEKESKEKNRESWYLSWALDSNPEERDKGKTTELGQAYFETENSVVQILDAPGHKMYVPNMILGVNQADIAVLVISARQNEFEAGFEKGGQTREHIYLAKASGISKICVLINKMDDITVSWSEERYNQIIKSTKKLLHTLFGKNEVVYMPISGFLGYNIKENNLSEVAPWYKGVSFFEYLNKINIVRENSALMYASVTDASKEMGGYFITVRVERGTLEKSQVKLFPGSRKVSVISITRDDEEIDKVFSGETARIKLKESDEIFPGDVLSALDYSDTKDSNYFMGSLSILDAKSLITKGYSAVMHMGAREVPVTIGDLYKKSDEKILKVKFAKTGDKLMGEIFVNSPIPLEVHTENRRTGIFTLRDETRTVGFGKVLKIKERK